MTIHDGVIEDSHVDFLRRNLNALMRLCLYLIIN